MRAVLLLFVCCLISAFCGTEGKEDQPLVEASANVILERDLREAGRDEKGRRKNSGRNSKKPKRENKTRKQKSKRKAKNQKHGKQGRTGKNKNVNSGRRRKVGQKNGGKRKGRKTGTKRKGGKGGKATKGKKLNMKEGRTKKKSSPRADASCNGTSLGASCLTDLINALKYERDAVANFMNQKARAEDFKKLIGKKGAKNDDFKNSTTYLLTALGGNVSNLTCGSQNTSGAGAVTTYTALANCSTAVSEACTVPNNTANFTLLDECKTYYENVQKTNAKCFKLTMKNDANETAVCECWKEAAAVVTEAKTKSSLCTSKTAQADMKILKDTCLASFSTCKKAEDASVAFILTCATADSSSSSSSNSSSSTTTSSVSSNSTSTNSTSSGRAQRLF